MNYIKTTLLSALLLSLTTLFVSAQNYNPLKENNSDFFKTTEAQRIGDQVLLWQRNTGGWPKNVDMAAPLDDAQRQKIIADKQLTDDSTIDNGATTTQMIFLARLWQQTKDERYRKAFLNGVNYLLSGQYDNGGWPQFWPKTRDYQIHITFNDDAMVNTMNLLRAICEGNEPYQGLSNDTLNVQLKKAFDKGIECILRTQMVINDTLTVWCQQHDRDTYAPAKARAYELPSYCSMESATIVKLLMSIPKPDARVRRAIHAAMAWFDKTKITGYRLERIGKKGEPGADTRLVADPKAEPLWARYYDLEHCQPYVCDRDGIPRKHLWEIGPERRNGYSWYNNRAKALYKKYAKWKKQWEK